MAKAVKETFATRLLALRKSKGLSQADIANAIGVHFAQISRYEREGSFPNAEALTKLANVLDTTTDYLINGSTTDTVLNAGLDKELISRFKEIQSLEKEEKKIVLSLFDAFIAKTKLKNILK